MGSQSKARHFSIASVDTIRLTTEQPLRTVEAMLALGFKPCKKRKWQGYILDLDPFKFRWSLHNYLSVEVSLPIAVLD